MHDAVEQIKDRLSIVDVVSSYVKLEKAGKNLKAKSPFSNEKTPSFYVSPERGMFYCFSTNQGGDIFTFVQKLEGVDFKGALKILAERAGVKLTPGNKKDADRRERLYALLELSTAFFEGELRATPHARAYLKDRGITDASVATWRIGYAPASFDALKHHLGKEGFTEDEMEASGVIKRRDTGSGFYDRFRGRIMFPISDTSGRVIAYSGRILPHALNQEYKDGVAKYINSPETVLYHKSRVLYGYHIAKNAIRKFNCSLLVEGQMDLVLSHQAGYVNTVAVSGTALTDEQLGLLERLSKNVIMAFDADRAGITSGEKGITRALIRGMDVKVVALPKGADPADIVRQNPSSWKALVGKAKHVIDFYLDYLSVEYTDKRKLRLNVAATVIPFLAHIQSRIDRAHFVARIAERLGIAEEPIWEELKSYTSKQAVHEAPRSREVYPSTDKGDTHPTRLAALRKTLLELYFYEERLPDSRRAFNVKTFKEKLEEVMGGEVCADMLARAAEDENRIMFEHEARYQESSRAAKDAEELLALLEKETLRNSYTEALEKLRIAEVSGDKETVTQMLKECERLSRALEKL